MARKAQKPIEKILMTRQAVELYLQYGDNALRGRSVNDLLGDVSECLNWLMDFRNIINGMVGFEEEPQDAVIPYLSDIVLDKARA